MNRPIKEILPAVSSVIPDRYSKKSLKENKNQSQSFDSVINKQTKKDKSLTISSSKTTSSNKDKETSSSPMSSAEEKKNLLTKENKPCSVVNKETGKEAGEIRKKETDDQTLIPEAAVPPVPVESVDSPAETLLVNSDSSSDGEEVNSTVLTLGDSPIAIPFVDNSQAQAPTSESINDEIKSLTGPSEKEGEVVPSSPDTSLTELAPVELIEKSEPNLSSEVQPHQMSPKISSFSKEVKSMGTVKNNKEVKNGKKEPTSSTDINSEIKPASGNVLSTVKSINPMDELKANLFKGMTSVDHVSSHPLSTPISSLSSSAIQPQNNSIPTETPSVPLTISGQSDKGVVDQIVQRFTVIHQAGGSHAQFEIEPKELGKLKMALQMDRDSVVVKFTVENEKVREIIQANLPHLRESLANQGLSVERFDVAMSGSGSGMDGRGESSTFSQTPTPSHSGSDGSENIGVMNDGESSNSSAYRVNIFA